MDPERSFGGGERQVLGLVRHLARRGHENVLAAPEGSAIVRLLPPGDARGVPLAVRNDVDLFAAFRLAHLVARERPDVVHLHTSRALALTLWLPRLAAPAVVTRRMDYPVRRGLRTRLLYGRRVAAVAAISEEVRRQLEAGGVAPERIRVIPSGVEVPDGLPGPAGREAARRRFGAGPETVIAVVAALETRKGHDVLLHALARAGARGLAFTALLCGDGSQRAALEEEAGRLGLSSHVRFLGEQRQVADVLAAADLFVLPSRKEGLGVAILEAMALGLPVVASAVGGIPESVEDGGTGLLVPPEDVDALAAAIARLARDPGLARRMGERGRERARVRFAMSAMADGYERLYGEVTGALRKSAGS